MRFNLSDSGKANEPHGWLHDRENSFFVASSFPYFNTSLFDRCWSSQLISGSAWLNVVLHVQDRWHLTIGVVLIKLFFPYWRQADLSIVVSQQRRVRSHGSTYPKPKAERDSGFQTATASIISLVLFRRGVAVHPPCYLKCSADNSDPVILARRVQLDHV
jgi:hypothetical protein